jgi:3',5'-cyclic AMP phosphodiesterase CpdA/thymidylate synthase
MQDSNSIFFLHITDLHFSELGTELNDRDFKNSLEKTPTRLKEDNFKRTLVGLLKDSGDKKISAILLTGDYDSRGPSGGMEQLRNILRDVFEKEVPPIVVVPGNHDVLRGTKPSSEERYKTFTECWRIDDKFITPFLDGVDDYDDVDSNWEKYCLVNEEKNNQFIIIPINSCNWSQSKFERQDKHNDFCNVLIKAINSSDPTAIKDFEKTLNQEMEKLLAVDAALISDEQFNALQKVIEKAEHKAGEGAIKIALIHHHLLPVNSREEHKIYSDIINLGKLRFFLRDHGFNILLHGHKHSNAVYVDHVYHEDSECLDAHEVLVVSGGTINSDGKDIFRIIELESLPNAPLCKINNVSMVKSGQKFTKEHIKEVICKPLWRSKISGEPTIISGKNINEVYERACQLFGKHKTMALDRTVICYIEFDELESQVSPPDRYPYYQEKDNTDKNDIKRNEELTEWFNETVKWWQLPISKIEARIPYIHGTRLYRFGGVKDQIDRIVKLLQKSNSTSKAIAVLLDPIRDFNNEPVKNPERFASFCFVQFKVYNKRLECIAYYRAQEFCKWWPVNVAELRKLQLEIGGKLKSFGIKTGGITTITGDARIEENVSPTQVAVPLIDQWLDSYPEKIAAMAHAVMYPNPDKSSYLSQWNRCFADILAATKDYTVEGIPIAVEGLTHLSLLLKEFSNKSNDHKELIKEVNSLLKANKQFCKNKDEDSFTTWSDQVNTHVNNISELTKKLTGAVQY